MKSNGCLEIYASEFVLVLFGLVLLDSISGYVFIFAVYFSCDDMYGMFLFKGVLFFHFLNEELSINRGNLVVFL